LSEIKGRSGDQDVSNHETSLSYLCPFLIGLKVCVLKDTTHVETLEKLMDERGYTPSTHIVHASTLRDLYHKLKDADCNVLAGDEFDVSQEVLDENDLEQIMSNENEMLSRELFSIVTRDGDAKFSEFANYILQSLMAAEEIRIRASAPIETSDVDLTEVFGSRYRTMFQDAFAVVGGHYGELYERHLATLVSRSYANEINGKTPAMYSKALGNLNVDDPPEQKSTTIAEIKERGRLRVGVTDSSVFSALVNGTRTGIDVDFAKAVSAALFDGEDKVDLWW